LNTCAQIRDDDARTNLLWVPETLPDWEPDQMPPDMTSDGLLAYADVVCDYLLDPAEEQQFVAMMFRAQGRDTEWIAIRLGLSREEVEKVIAAGVALANSLPPMEKLRQCAYGSSGERPDGLPPVPLSLRAD
jgi:hypothetical protein